MSEKMKCLHVLCSLPPMYLGIQSIILWLHNQDVLDKLFTELNEVDKIRQDMKKRLAPKLVLDKMEMNLERLITPLSSMLQPRGTFRMVMMKLSSLITHLRVKGYTICKLMPQDQGVRSRSTQSTNEERRSYVSQFVTCSNVNSKQYCPLWT